MLLLLSKLKLSLFLFTLLPPIAQHFSFRKSTFNFLYFGDTLHLSWRMKTEKYLLNKKKTMFRPAVFTKHDFHNDEHKPRIRLTVFARVMNFQTWAVLFDKALEQGEQRVVKIKGFQIVPILQPRHRVRPKAFIS